MLSYGGTQRTHPCLLLCMRRLPPRLTKSSSVPFQCGKLRSKGDWESWILPEGWGRPSRGMVSSLCRSLWSRRSGRDRCRNFIAIRLIGCWWRRPSLKGWFWSRLTSKYCGTRFRICDSVRKAMEAVANQGSWSPTHSPEKANGWDTRLMWDSELTPEP